MNAEVYHCFCRTFDVAFDVAGVVRHHDEPDSDDCWDRPDKHDEIESLATFAAGLGNIERVDVLPFHKLGEHKWRDRGLDYRLERVQPPSHELLEEVRETFRAAGLLVN